jgi:hypothetical protein
MRTMKRISSGVPAHGGRDGAGDTVLSAWKLPFIVAAISVSIVAGFYLGGPGLGMAVGGLAAGSIIVMAIRHPPLHPIVPVRASDGRRRLLVVLTEPLEDSEGIERIANAGRGGAESPMEPEILVLAPASHRFLDRWASDFERGRRQAQRALVLSLASLARAELTATACVGEEDPVLAVEDQLRSYPASGVILVTGDRQRDPMGQAAAAELRARLRAPFHHLPQALAGTDRSQLEVMRAR